MNRNRLPWRAWLASLLVASSFPAQAGTVESPASPSTSSGRGPAANMAVLVRQFESDRQAVQRFYDLPWSTQRFDRVDKLISEWRERLRPVAFTTLEREGQIDYLLLRNELDSEAARLKFQRARLEEMAPLLPFRQRIQALEVARWRMEKLEPSQAAAAVSEIPELVRQVRQDIEKGRKKKPAEPAARAADPKKDARAEPAVSAVDAGDVVANPPSKESAGLAVSPVVAQRTAAAVGELRNTLKSWAAYYDGVLPEFSWWLKKPNETALSALDDYSKFLREEIAGLKGKDEDPLVGDPIGAAALASDLAAEWLAYSAEELLAIGEKEFAWCEAEMKKATAEMGLGEDWKAALARVKAGFVPPGQQDQVVTEAARSAIDFLKKKELVTIPPLCEELWRTSMLSSDAQKTLPFAAYNGPNMLVAYARDDMKHEDKLMAMRGNNRHFTRIVTAHELIPGHHLEAFMTARYNEHRRPFRTPFFVEGWALYWEIVLWNQGYGRTPEERVGMLFWRMHRCARIVVSLKFHLGQMTPDQMVNFLVERVGHERSGATSEVRRFIGSAYSPLYQCAYMIGGLQLKALRDEMVGPSTSSGRGGGRMTDKQFNDAVLRLGAIPIEMVRAALTTEPLTAEQRPAWRPLATSR